MKSSLVTSAIASFIGIAATVAAVSGMWIAILIAAAAFLAATTLISDTLKPWLRAQPAKYLKPAQQKPANNLVPCNAKKTQGTPLPKGYNQYEKRLGLAQNFSKEYGLDIRVATTLVLQDNLVRLEPGAGLAAALRLAAVLEYMNGLSSDLNEVACDIKETEAFDVLVQTRSYSVSEWKARGQEPPYLEDVFENSFSKALSNTEAIKAANEGDIDALIRASQAECSDALG